MKHQPLTPISTAVAAALALGLLAGCTVGPDYKRIELDLPATLASGSTGATPVVEATWWRHFKDTSLDTLVEETLINNRDLMVAAGRIDEAQALLGLAVSDQMPTAYASASRDRSRLSPASARTGPGQTLETTNNRATLNLSFEIDFWGKYRRGSEAARADLLSVQANRDTLQLSLTAQVVQSYFTLQALDAQIRGTELAIKRGEEGLELQRRRYDAGVISLFEFQQRTAEVDSARAQLPPLQTARGKQERAIAVLAGRTPKAITTATIARSEFDKPATSFVLAAGIPSSVLLARPDLVEAEQKLIATNARIGVARAAFFPAISLTGAFGGESASLGDLFTGPARAWNFGGNLIQPLWGAGRVNRQVEASEARNQQALAQYQNAIANAFREAQDAIQAQASSREVYIIESRRVTALESSWKLAKQRYENGLTSQLEVIDAERSLLTAELGRIEAMRGLRVAAVDLLKALGGRVTN
jgi:multidrug efflux system outer membrane protein